MTLSLPNAAEKAKWIDRTPSLDTRAEVARTTSRRVSGSEREQIFMVRVEFLRACFKNPVRMRDEIVSIAPAYHDRNGL